MKKQWVCLTIACLTIGVLMLVGWNMISGNKAAAEVTGPLEGEKSTNKDGPTAIDGEVMGPPGGEKGTDKDGGPT